MDMRDVDSRLYEITGKKTVWLDDAAMLDAPGELPLYLEYCREGDELYFHADIAALSGEALARCALTLLEGNLFGRDTGGSAVLAYDAEAGRVVLWDKLPLSGMTAEAFKERFSYFYLARLHWIARLRDEASEPVGAGPMTIPAFITGS